MLMFWDVSIHKKYRNCATWARGILLSSEKSNYQLPCLRIAAKLRGVSLHLESEMKESHLNMKVRELNLSWMQPLADLQSSLPREIWVSCHRTQKSYEKIASPKCSECIRSVIWEYFDVVLVQTFIFTWANNLWTEICAPTIHYSQQLFFEFGDKKMMIFSDANFFWSRKKLARDANLTYIRRWPKITLQRVLRFQQFKNHVKEDEILKIPY